MSKVFTDADDLLRSVGTVVLYYFLFLDATARSWVDALSRAPFEKFEKLRADNRSAAESEVTRVSFELLEFDRLAQSPNDALALQYRYAVLRQHIGPVSGRPDLPQS